MADMINRADAVKIADELYKLYDGRGSQYNAALSDYEDALYNIPSAPPNLSPTGELIGSKLEMEFRTAFRKVMRHHNQPSDGVIEADVIRDILTVLNKISNND